MRVEIATQSVSEGEDGKGGRGDNSHMDELSSVMLERDTLSHSNEELQHQNEQVRGIGCQTVARFM